MQDLVGSSEMAQIIVAPAAALTAEKRSGLGLTLLELVVYLFLICFFFLSILLCILAREQRSNAKVQVDKRDAKDTDGDKGTYMPEDQVNENAKLMDNMDTERERGTHDPKRISVAAGSVVEDNLSKRRHSNVVTETPMGTVDKDGFTIGGTMKTENGKDIQILTDDNDKTSYAHSYKMDQRIVSHDKTKAARQTKTDQSSNNSTSYKISQQKDGKIGNERTSSANTNLQITSKSAAAHRASDPSAAVSKKDSL